ncbi:hypothetical protein [Photobacterium sp. TY1-4]|uniref:hypothetical protein n=1 Tax=Photobacterium sp. TY1-4 TaxID=2899122 RepID=UPI0021C1E563|nr:hypothetical protein [Photobacterium sp. TY1-4]UXI04353.1 hypothetical protein NH461_19890 [Photobacterium sp. TY1-4]
MTTPYKQNPVCLVRFILAVSALTVPVSGSLQALRAQASDDSVDKKNIPIGNFYFIKNKNETFIFACQVTLFRRKGVNL